MLPLARLATVENKLATRTRLEQQVRAVACADATVGTLSLVACARLAGKGGETGRGRSRSQALEESNNVRLTAIPCNF